MYIPHHGINHQRKTRKIKVVFDCIAEFNDKSIKEQLISSPDLDNLFIDVLTRFWQFDFVILTYVLQSEHGHVTRFLLWKDWELNTKPVDQKMKCHAIGEYHHLIVENERKLGNEGGNTFRQSFYVDDILKLVSSPPEPVWLIKNTKEICATGGLKLAKFVSNRREMVMSIPEADT